MLAHEIITGIPQEITALLDTTLDRILKEFKCNACGRTVFKYYGGIKLLIPGATEIEWIDIVGRPFPVQCKNKRMVFLPGGKKVEVKCKTVYYVIG